VSVNGRNWSTWRLHRTTRAPFSNWRFQFAAFLVPLIHLRRVLSVLVVPRAPAHRFSSDEVAFLVTIAA
jgi:hypothetical protein